MNAGFARVLLVLLGVVFTAYSVHGCALVRLGETNPNPPSLREWQNYTSVTLKPYQYVLTIDLPDTYIWGGDIVGVKALVCANPGASATINWEQGQKVIKATRVGLNLQEVYVTVNLYIRTYMGVY